MANSKAVTAVTNAVSNLSGYIISIALGLASYPIIINFIGIEAVGVFALIMVVVAPLDLTNLGFAEATIKYVSQYAAINDYDKVKQYISTTLFFSAVVGIVGMVIIFFAGPPIGFAFFDFKSQSYEVIRICFAMAALGWLIRQLTTVFLGISMALQKFKVVALGNSITSIVSTSAILITIYFMRNLEGYALGTLIGAALSLMIWIIIITFNFRDVHYSFRFYPEVWRNSARFGGWQTLSGLGSVITNQADKYILGAYLPAAISGVYNVVFQAQQRILSVVWKIAEVMFPMFSASSDQNQDVKFRALMRANYLLSAFGVLIFFPFAILSYDTLQVWVNSEFADIGHIAFRCLLIVGVFASITVIQTFFLMGNAMVKQLTLITYFTSISTIIGAILLIPAFGINGAGYGILFAAATRLILFYFIMKRYFTDNFSWNEYLVSTLLPLASGLLVMVIYYRFILFNGGGVLSLLLNYALVAFSILLLLFLSNILIPQARRHNHETLTLLKQVTYVFLKRKSE